MNFPTDVKYAETHEWVRVEGSTAYVGITDFAQDSLGDIVFVEMPEVGRAVQSGDEICTIESVKAASPIFAPVSGAVEAVNKELESKPELVNQKPYEAFLFAIKMSNTQEIDKLLDSSAYEAFVNKEKEKH
ncbi:MAG: glycine cleavage system protein GcvH [Spirochaetota bacterium]